MRNINKKPHNCFCRRTRREFLWQAGGAFTSDHNGAYAITLGEGAVKDLSGKGVAAATGSFAVNIAIQGPIVGQPLVVVIRKQPVLTAIERALAGHPSVDRIALGSGETERQIEIRTVPD